MRNLLSFLYRFNGLLIFLVLQVFCFTAIFKFNGFHRLVYLGGLSNSLVKIYNWENEFSSYLDLREQNLKLNQENTLLKSQLRNAYFKTSNTFVLYQDTLFNRQYEFTSAEVINSSINRQLNYITINVGSNSGIMRGMGVIAQNGIVGVVDKVSKNFSLVLPVINTRFVSSVEFRNKAFFGLMKWDGGNYQTVQINDIASHANIQLGDTVQTRGSSSIFPSEIPIGIVSSVEQEEGENYLSVEALLFEDFGTLQHVQVVRNLYKTEQKEIEITKEK